MHLMNYGERIIMVVNSLCNKCIKHAHTSTHTYSARYEVHMDEAIMYQ